MVNRPMVLSGLDVLMGRDFEILKNRRVALLTNPSGVDRELISTFDRLSHAVNLVAIFSPEHGFSGSARAGESVPSSRDRSTGIPIHSLYGDSYRPTPEQLNGIDVIVCDLQDVGVRYFTYIWTLSYVLEAAGEMGISVVVLDRPNPLGDRIDGNMPDEDMFSFVGRFPIPIQHGMTIGELARMINTVWNPTPADLEVIPCAALRRYMSWQDTGMQWIPPSPNLPHFVNVQHYAGACLIEGTNLSEGRGTTLPFEIVGAPWLDRDRLANRLNDEYWEHGVGFRPIVFQPNMGKYVGEVCSGVQAHILQPYSYRSVRVWLGIIALIREWYPEQFAWSENEARHFDLLLGTRQIRLDIEKGVSVSEITASWEHVKNTFSSHRNEYLLYET